MVEEYEVNLEIIFDLLRQEKEHDEIQEIPKDFFKKAHEYILSKESNLDLNDLASINELRNIKKLIRDLYYKREKKIIDLALMSSKSKISLINPDVLTPEEIELFKQVEFIIKTIRESVLNNKPLELNKSKDIQVENSKKDEKKMINVRFLANIQSFVDENLDEYGPFKKDDIALIPKEIADMLLKKRKIEIINQD